MRRRALLDPIRSQARSPVSAGAERRIAAATPARATLSAELQDSAARQPQLNPSTSAMHLLLDDECSAQSVCNCKSSNCLKLYCECFAVGSYCGALCDCRDCKNVATNEAELERHRRAIRGRNSNAFEDKVSKQSGMKRHSRGCKCVRSRCVKRYCECFREGMACTEACTCVSCENTEAESSREGSAAAEPLRVVDSDSDEQWCLLDLLEDSASAALLQ